MGFVSISLVIVCPFSFNFYRWFMINHLSFNYSQIEIVIKCWVWLFLLSSMGNPRANSFPPRLMPCTECTSMSRPYYDLNMTRNSLSWSSFPLCRPLSEPQLEQNVLPVNEAKNWAELLSTTLIVLRKTKHFLEIDCKISGSSCNRSSKLSPDWGKRWRVGVGQDIVFIF